jgi:hypothetical protein
MDDLFESAWQKWSWAVIEAERLKEQITAWTEDEDTQRLNTITCHYHANRHGFILTVDALAAPPPSIALMLSTVAHHFRSSLDNLAWALVSRGKTPPDTLDPHRQRAIAFPVCETRDDFQACLIDRRKRYARLPGITSRDRTVVRNAQPYKHGNTKRPYHSLVILTAFNNVDKHRTLQPVIFLPERVAYEVTDHRDCLIREMPRQARRKVLKVGAELTRFPAKRIGPDPYMDVEYQLATLPALHETLSLEEWLTQTSKLIGALLIVLGGARDESKEIVEFVAALASGPR